MTFPTVYVNQFNNSPIQPTYSSLLKVNATAIVKLEWPFLNPATTTPFSQVILVNVLAGSPNNKIQMPDATYAGIGQTVVVINKSSQVCNLLDFEGNLIVDIPTGQSVLVTLTDNSDTDGVWTYTTLGANNSTSLAAALAGYGLSALSGNTLNVVYTLKPITSGGTYNLTSADRWSILLFDSAPATIIQCPLISSLGNGFSWIVQNIFSNVDITVQANSNNKMNNTPGASFVVKPGFSVEFLVDVDLNNIFTLGVTSTGSYPKLGEAGQTSIECYSGVPTQEITVQQAQSDIQQFIEGVSPPQANLTLVYPTNLTRVYYFWNKTSRVLNVQLYGGVNVYPIQPDDTLACFSGSFNNAWDLYPHTSS